MFPVFCDSCMRIGLPVLLIFGYVIEFNRISVTVVYRQRITREPAEAVTPVPLQ